MDLSLEEISNSWPKSVCLFSGTTSHLQKKKFGLLSQRYRCITNPLISRISVFVKVFRLLYCSPGYRYEIDIKLYCHEFVEAVKSHDSTLLNKQKFHLFLHLHDSIIDFGPQSAYNTERKALKYYQIINNDRLYTGVNILMA